MQVKHGLSCTRADVEDGAISVFDVALAGNLRGSEMAAADHFGVLRLRLFESCKMFLGNDQNVRGRLGVDVFKGEDVLVFVNFLRRKLAAEDAAEGAMRIVHRGLT